MNSAHSRCDKNQFLEGQGTPHLLFQDNIWEYFSIWKLYSQKVSVILGSLFGLFFCLHVYLTYFLQPFISFVASLYLLCSVQRRHQIWLFPSDLHVLESLPPAGMPDYPSPPADMFLSASKCHPHKEPFSIQPLQGDMISSELGMLGAPSIWLSCPALYWRYLYILYWKLPEGRAPVLPDFILPVTQHCLAWGDTGVEGVFVHVELPFLPFQNGVYVIWQPVKSPPPARIWK